MTTLDPPAADTAVGGPPGSERTSLLSLSIVGVLVVLLADTQGIALIPLFGRLQTDFGLDAAQVGWTIAATLLAGAATTPTIMRIGDRFGMKKLLIGSLVLGAIGNAVCAAAPQGPGVLLTGRIIVGLAGAPTPIMYAILRARSTSEAEVQRGSGVLTAATGIGGVVGLLVGGAVLELGGSSRTVFWVTAVFAAIVVAVAVALVPEITTRTAVPVDLLGVVLIAAGMFGVVLGISKGAEWGWAAAPTLSLLIGGVVLLALFCLWEWKAKNPMVDLTVVANRRVFPPMLGAGFIGGLAIYTLLTTTGYAESPPSVGYGFGASVLHSALYLASYVILMTAGGAVAQPIVQRLGLRWTAAISCLLVAAGNFWMSANHSEAWNYLVGLAFVGFGFGVAYAALYAMYLSGARLGESGLVTGAGQLVVGLVGAIGTTIYTAILTADITVVSTDPPVAVPSAHGYTNLWLVPALFAVGAVLLVGITRSVIFRQELAENTVLRDTEPIATD
jgi:MFS family permease